MELSRRCLGYETCGLDTPRIDGRDHHEVSLNRQRRLEATAYARMMVAQLRSSGRDDVQRIRDLHSPEKPAAVDHQILLNWLLLHLVHLEKVIPQLRIHLVAQPRPIGEPIQPVGSPRSGRGEPRSPGATIPDAVFSITCAEQGKTVLFFPEVDMATETMAGPITSNGDFRSKVLGYQALFRTSAYTTYEAAWHCSLRGFRLLV